MGLWKETALMRNLSPQVHLVVVYHPRCWEDILPRCSLVTDVTDASDGEKRCNHQLHHFMMVT